MPPKSNPRAAAAFRRRLSAWYRRAARDLPWRRTRDPWAVVVSEFMLQQTQVQRVLDFYPRFLSRYPTARHLASAPPSAVREAWDGLGYYRRAENLHALAKLVVRKHGGRVPSEADALTALPGVGPYTAGAVACFAYEQPSPTVDTNVARVLVRFFGKGHGGTGARKKPGARTSTRADAQPADGQRGGRRKQRGMPEAQRLRELAQSLQPRRGKAAWIFNQALMELGALVCTAQKPKCGECPVRGECRWYGSRSRADG